MQAVQIHGPHDVRVDEVQKPSRRAARHVLLKIQMPAAFAAAT